MERLIVDNLSAVLGKLYSKLLLQLQLDLIQKSILFNCN